MFEAEKGAPDPNRLDGCGLSIGIVQARFNGTITDSLTLACKRQLLELGVDAGDIDHVLVPGALEIPLALQVMAESDLHDALIAIGCIVRGETYHFELVANESGAGVTRVALDHSIPVVNAILTTENIEQAEARQTEKGRDAALVAVEMARLIAALSQR
ncbi:MAG: 6,7-dimethyl-8-ribityllumazine synthase [Burkholderiales bacterium]